MNYFFVFDLGGGSDVVLVSRLGVREVAAVLAYAFPRRKPNPPKPLSATHTHVSNSCEAHNACVHSE